MKFEVENRGLTFRLSFTWMDFYVLLGIIEFILLINH